MRKTILVLVLFFTAWAARGQLFTGGVAGGLAASQIEGDEYAGYYKAGGSLGAWTRTNLKGKLQVQMEVRYIMKGAGKQTNTEDPSYYRVQLHYAEVPLLAVYTLRKKLAFESGIGFAFLIASGEDLDGYGYLDPDPPFRGIDLNWQAGVNYAFTSRISGDIRFSYSLIPVRNHPGSQTYRLNQGQYNNTVGFAISYRLNK
jgi:hypothetical protein